MHWGCLGATLGDEVFTDLDYAYDVALLAEMQEVLLLSLDIMREEAVPFGLEINWGKTKIQTTVESKMPLQQVYVNRCAPLCTSAARWIARAAAKRRY